MNFWTAQYGQAVIQEENGEMWTLYYAWVRDGMHNIIVTSTEIEGMSEEVERQMEMVDCGA